MDDVRGDFLGPPHGTTPAAVGKTLEKNERKNENREIRKYLMFDGCLISLIYIFVFDLYIFNALYICLYICYIS